jgi:hypothetical protein
VKDIKIKAAILIVGLVLGVGGAAAGILISPQLHGIEKEFRCVGCHGQLHAAVQLDSLPYNAIVDLTGDVVKPGFITVNDVFPYRASEPKSVSLPEFIKTYGSTTDYSRVILVSTDGGRVSLEREYISEKSLLVPFLEGIRFTDENQHASTWLKGISEIIVVGNERKVAVDGKPYTMGGLLAGPTVSVSAEGGTAMKANLKTDAIFRGEYAHLYKGAVVGNVVAERDYKKLTATDRGGKSYDLSREESDGCVLTIVDGKTTLVLPKESRRLWVFDLVDLKSSK